MTNNPQRRGGWISRQALLFWIQSGWQDSLRVAGWKEA